jgi:hypothetical protein
MTTVTLHPGDLVISRADRDLYTAGRITWAELLTRACEVAEPPRVRQQSSYTQRSPSDTHRCPT